MRVVIQHTHGAWAGIYQILGTLEAVRKGMGVDDLPAYIPDVDFGDRKNSASLVGARGSFLLYRETMGAANNQPFHPEQR